jgi:hypothetical protein
MRKYSKGVTLIAVSFSLVVVLVLMPVVVQGGWDSFLDYCWINKKRYLAIEHCNYFLIPSSWDSYSVLIFLAPFLTVGFLIHTFFLEKENTAQAVLGFFLVASLLNLYPRPDNVHKMTCIPFLLIVIAYGYSKMKSKLNPAFQKYLKTGVSLWFLYVLIVALGLPALSFIKGKKTVSQLCHFRRIVLDKEEYQHWKKMKNAFATLGLGKKDCFFLSTHGGFYYLLFRLKNPAPFDYPVHPALGCRGEEQIIHLVKTQQIKKLLMDHKRWSNWLMMEKDRRPYHLEAFLTQNMHEVQIEWQPDLRLIFSAFQKD